MNLLGKVAGLIPVRDTIPPSGVASGRDSGIKKKLTKKTCQIECTERPHVTREYIIKTK